jgi:adsorption protein B
MFDLTDATVAYVNPRVGLFLVFGGAIIRYILDDVVVDIIYWAMRISGTIRAERSHLSEQSLLEQPQRPLAVMVPAWREEAVIYEMLKTNAAHSATTVFFVGAYPNDAATQREVLRAAAELPENVRLVIGPHNGPTTKADCLNAVIAEIGKYEKDSNIEFQGFVLHDSEDVIHPLEFPLFSALIATFDFIQIPVYSFRRTLLQMTAGTYMDEFAEFHSKDLFVRQRLTGVIPCAGVAACFGRRAIEALKSWRQGEVFDPVALTEDYDVAFAMKSLGLKSAFVLNEAPYTLDIPRGTDQVQRIATPLAIAAREHFPSDYRAAYRQRARWLLGIGFQGASKLGWGNTLTERLFFSTRPQGHPVRHHRRRRIFPGLRRSCDPSSWNSERRMAHRRLFNARPHSTGSVLRQHPVAHQPAHPANDLYDVDLWVRPRSDGGAEGRFLELHQFLRGVARALYFRLAT